MRSLVIAVGAIIVIGMSSCNTKSNANPNPKNTNPKPLKTISDMSSYISLFEIPATDISRAIKFYETILDISIEKVEMPEMEIGVLPYENREVHGVIMRAEGLTPSENGVVIYLNAGNDLQPTLDKIEANGGKIVIPKTAHADGIGFFAIFIDSEGNKMGLNSPN